MAEMIPDRLPRGASKGEKIMFEILQKLPESCLVYYEPVIADRYPDFVVISPELGVLIVEVKGWYPKHIVGGDMEQVIIHERGHESRTKHPLRQARDYMYNLMDHSRHHTEYGKLLNPAGKHQGKFAFPFGYAVVLSNITGAQLHNHPVGDLTAIFPNKKVITRDVLLETWQVLEEDQLIKTLKELFDPWWRFEPLDERTIDALRAIIHPEIVISDATVPEAPSTLDRSRSLPLKVLDTRQENNARNIGTGHRIIYGVAGSGKTVLLIARARLLSRQAPEAPILVLCYNVAFAAYLQSQLDDLPNVDVYHFHGWAKKHGLRFSPGESDETLGEKLLERLENGYGDAEYYDTVLIDEAQDFVPNWFQCVLSAMRDPNDGDLLIVGDGSQGLYRDKRTSWKALGIHAQGRTVHAKFDLDKNYRNTREIVELASIFIEDSMEDGSRDTQEADGIVAMVVDPRKTLRSTGQRPPLFINASREAEIDTIVQTIVKLLDGESGFGGIDGPIAPDDIAILYRYAGQRNRPLLETLISRIQAVAPVVWLSASQEDKSRIDQPGVKILTMHSSKGLQYRVVFVIFADQLPPYFTETEADLLMEHRLMYVALTRAEDVAIVTSAGRSMFVEMMQRSDQAEVHYAP